jgi:hypothetical protein
MLREATDEDLQDLLDETDRSSQHAEIRKALGEEPLGKVQAYEQMLIVKVKDELAKRKSADQSAPGGIDMNANALDLQSEGKGGRFDITFDPAKWENLKFDGFTPVILQINTTNLPLFIGAKEVDRTIQLSRI